MKKLTFISLISIIAVFFSITAYAAEPNFEASLLTAESVDCKKCHVDTPHIIHARKSVNCVNCHGEKTSVSIPSCTNCHNGPIHKVHEGRVNTQACSFCHNNIEGVHNALTGDAVCSHCHQSLTEAHGQDDSCIKCHQSPPEIVKPLQLEGMTLVCQNCHPQSSVASIHGEEEDKEGCYNCHKGTSDTAGSQVVHTIHGNRVQCQDCHGADQQIFVPRCTQCHKIDELHGFDKIARLTARSGLQCSVCHPEISGSPEPEAVEVKGPETLSHAGETQETMNVENEDIPEEETPGFQIWITLGILITGYIVRKRN